jgi:hypothetical protein
MRREKRISPRLKAKAEKRYKALWDYYNANGRIYLADVKRITQGQYAAVVEQMKTYGFDCPPVYDSQIEKYKRKARSLLNEVERLKQDFLTVDQAARCLGVRPSEVIGTEKRLLKAGLSLPEIRMDKERGNDQYAESRKVSEWADRMNGVCNPLYHPQGLQVLDYWEGPKEGEITYLLR